MRLGLLADIHGNADALAAVLQAAARQGVDALCVAGDFVGYYYQPDLVLRMLSQWTVHAVRGNHEDMLGRAAVDKAFLDQCTARYGSGLAVALEKLTPAELAFLHNLPASRALEFDGRKLMLAHGSPWNVDQYIYPDAPADMWGKLGALEATDLVIMGHTHYRVTRTSGPVLIVNPGSVGQPRDGAQGACWSLFDTESASVRGFVESYDTSNVIREARMRDPHVPYLHEIFDRK